MKSIWDCAFEYSSSLTSIEIPSGVTSIGVAAFSDCSNLKDVYYTGTEEKWKEISIESGKTHFTSATINFNSHMPESSENPEVSEEPASSKEPSVTEEPATSKNPEVSDSPVVTTDPSNVTSPIPVSSPTVTSKPTTSNITTSTTTPTPTPTANAGTGTSNKNNNSDSSTKKPGKVNLKSVKALKGAIKVYLQGFPLQMATLLR